MVSFAIRRSPNRGAAEFRGSAGRHARFRARFYRGEVLDLIGELLIAVRGLAESEPTAHNWFAFALEQDVDYWRLLCVASHSRITAITSSSVVALMRS